MIRADFYIRVVIDGKEYVFEYEASNIFAALEEFWHEDYPEFMGKLGDTFDFDTYSMIGPEVERVRHWTFNTAMFHAFFDHGHKYDGPYNEKDFLKDIERKQEAEEENPLIYIRVLQHDTCDQVRIGESFPAWKTRLDKVVENTKKSYVNETPRYGTFENIADRFYRRVALVDAETLQSVREIYNNPDNKPKPLEL